MACRSRTADCNGAFTALVLAVLLAVSVHAAQVGATTSSHARGLLATDTGAIMNVTLNIKSEQQELPPELLQRVLSNVTDAGGDVTVSAAQYGSSTRLKISLLVPGGMRRGASEALRGAIAHMVQETLDDQLPGAFHVTLGDSAGDDSASGTSADSAAAAVAAGTDSEAQQTFSRRLLARLAGGRGASAGAGGGAAGSVVLHMPLAAKELQGGMKVWEQLLRTVSYDATPLPSKPRDGQAALAHS